MPKCSQCDRPALYAVNSDAGQVPLCLQCGALHQSIIDRQLAALERQQETALDQMEMVAGVRLPGRRRTLPPPPVIVGGSTFHNITIRNSNVGVVNTGHLHQVDTAVSVIGRQGDAQLAGALKRLTEAVVASTTMESALKEETVEILSVLSAEATTAKEQRRSAAARPLLARLRELLSTSADLAVVAQALWPAIAAAFGMHGG